MELRPAALRSTGQTPAGNRKGPHENLRAEQRGPSRSQDFRRLPFFSDADDLEGPTPPWLRFQVVTAGPIRMQVGTRIEYRLRLRGVPIRWISEITAWEPPHRFVDRQVKGPYRLWIHAHRLRDSEQGAICEDTVRYAVWGGAVVNRLAVERDVKRIFGYRREKLLEIFRPDDEPGS